MGAIITNTIKEYPDMIHIYIYKQPSYLPDSTICFNRKRKNVSDDDYIAITRSITRTKVLISDLILCNDFEFFATFTFNPKKIDRYNYDKCMLRMTGWLRSQRASHSPDLQYLIVPEKHKDGAYHFHALLKNYNGNVKPTKIYQKGRQVYNLTGYRFGFSTCVKIDNKEAVSRYIQKYITKDFVRMFNRRRFMASHNLIRPIHHQNSFYIKEFLKSKYQSFYDNDGFWFYSFLKKDIDRKLLNNIQ